ncbi:MAG: hypothetical protein IT158_28260 [Bryobacterales bacterium]|nr:hypothetical protein [Bryobacterales bacterium]
MPSEAWDYLILTASNAAQAEAYRSQLEIRRQLGLLGDVRRTLVVPDPEGRRIGSGGSTLECLQAVLRGEADGRAAHGDAEAVLRGLRILIVHAGGDSRRLPAYGPCGKIFVPVPGPNRGALPLTLFDRLAPAFLDLPSGIPGRGQIVMTSGDALIRFDPSRVGFTEPGITALAAYAPPEEAARHGVFCRGKGSRVRLYLQKPSEEEMRRQGALSLHGRAALDIGVMSLDAAAAAVLLAAFDSPGLRARIAASGLDFYREICCALGEEATLEHFVRAARSGGSLWEEDSLALVFPKLRAIPFHLAPAPRARFLHFGSTRQLIASGLALTARDRGAASASTVLALNNEVREAGGIAGRDAWVEGCRLTAPLNLAGSNLAAGLDVERPLALPENACLDVLEGRKHDGERAWFVRCYGIEDAFKDARFHGRQIEEWLASAGLDPDAVWDEGAERILWNARVFPAESDPQGYRRWIWMFAPERATDEERRAFRQAARYSSAEIAVLACQEAFHARRAGIRAAVVRRSLAALFHPASPFSSDDLACAVRNSERPEEFLADLLSLARSNREAGLTSGGLESFSACRILHSAGAAVPLVFGRAAPRLPRPTLDWLASVDAPLNDSESSGAPGERLRAAAFQELNRAILASSLHPSGRPRNVLRPDETVWGRAPARLELGGGWTDTPPYSLEHGGDVTNVAINLNGQPPIHCYGRIIGEPVIRLSSIDGGLHVEVGSLEELLDYRRPEDRFALTKAALAISGFSPRTGGWGPGITLRRMLEDFGGGIELTTLVGIPKGSGLGTSSILGAVIVAVIRRMLGRGLDPRVIFHEVLRLEQALTTGGGWQDQIGGGVGGAKLTSTRPGMFPDPRIHYVPGDLFDPKLNGGSTLLYYTGLTRLAKNILHQVVGGYLNRDRGIMATLAREHEVAHAIADAMGRKDPADFGRHVNEAWELQKRLCRDVTNESIECLLARARPHVHGMRISGAGSGGFLLMICKSPGDAARVRAALERQPLNERSRFFDFDINGRGLEVVTC